MTDADVDEEIDEWDAMHMHEIEAANEELLCDKDFELWPAEENQKQQLTTTKLTFQPPTSNVESVEKREQGLEDINSRLDKVLARCATLLGDDDKAMENVQPRLELTMHNGKQSLAANEDTTTVNHLYTRPLSDIQSIPVVLNGGKRMFIRKKRLVHVSFNCMQGAATSLIPMKMLMKKIEQMEIDEEAAKEDETMLQDLSLANKELSIAPDALLWLDKYKPQSFLELLSDERINREVLSWMKSWDRFVFPHKRRTNGSHPHSPGKFGISGKSQWNLESSKKDQNGNAVEDDEDKRPISKIIMICGPPGAGKTTLANIVARHAGYNPIEVNASDDRTAPVLRNKIVSAMEMQSICGKGKGKPNCIILDEIDGAVNGSDGKSAIDVILEIANAPWRTNKARSKTAGKNRHPLTRPLICICNNLYASVLRPLRQMSTNFTLSAPHSRRLISRLKFICRSESVKVSTNVLAVLCSSAGNDIRYCLNMLQLQTTQLRVPRSSKSAVITLDSGLVAQKDHVHGMFEALDLVFYEARAKMSKRETPVADNIIQAVASLGNFSLLISGLDENVPKMIFNDPTMRKVCEIYQWLGLADECEHRACNEQQFAFQAYIPFAAIATHASCCTCSRRRVEYPRVHFKAQKRRDRSERILVALKEGAQLQPILRKSTSILVLDVVPWLVASLAPNIRRSNPSLHTQEEKVTIQRLIELMASLGLSFRHNYFPDRGEDYVLEPPLNELVKFRSSEGVAEDHIILPLTMRKMIAREVELEKLRRNENSTLLVQKKESKGLSKASDALNEITIEEKAAKAAFDLPQLSDAEMVKKNKALRKRNPFAFAHREAKRKRDEELHAISKHKRKNDVFGDCVVRYKFNEGYTCGIKTIVYVRDLI